MVKKFDFDLTKLGDSMDNGEVDSRALAQLYKSREKARIFCIVAVHQPINRAQVNDEFKRLFTYAHKTGNMNKHLTDLVILGVINTINFYDATTNSEMHTTIKNKHEVYYKEKAKYSKYNINTARYFFLTDMGERIASRVFERMITPKEGY